MTTNRKYLLPLSQSYLSQAGKDEMMNFHNCLALRSMQDNSGYYEYLYYQERQKQLREEKSSRLIASMRPHCAHCFRPVENPAHWRGHAPIHKGACLEAVVREA